MISCKSAVTKVAYVHVLINDMENIFPTSIMGSLINGCKCTVPVDTSISKEWPDEVETLPEECHTAPYFKYALDPSPEDTEPPKESINTKDGELPKPVGPGRHLPV